MGKKKKRAKRVLNNWVAKNMIKVHTNQVHRDKRNRVKHKKRDREGQEDE